MDNFFFNEKSACEAQQGLGQYLGSSQSTGVKCLKPNTVSLGWGHGEMLLGASLAYPLINLEVLVSKIYSEQTPSFLLPLPSFNIPPHLPALKRMLWQEVFRDAHKSPKGEPIVVREGLSLHTST